MDYSYQRNRGSVAMQLNLDLAEKIAKRAREKAKELGISVTVSIVDQSGRLILTMRGDGTGFLTPETSRGKAIAAAAFGMPTKKMVELQQSNPAFWSALPAFAHDVLPTTGAVPIKDEGQVIGAIGCGGGTGDQDHECAVAGAEALMQLVK
jgi:glc operon protein GlcG